ncbi:MAG TPA: hypothetical protein VFO60_01765 [Candidatus Dormibacteraeota bacterium]|nr:hypothetical protein [Candidatus Dormibacteraeota bacterium]
MGFFRRDRRDAAALDVTVGVRNERLRLNGVERGVTTLDELRGYVASVTGGAAAPVDGRDPVAVLSAKMDLAELVDDTAAAARLALEDLVERGTVAPAAVPSAPVLPPLGQRLTNDEYIQATHARTQVRLRWLEQVDALLRAHDAALLPPKPEEDPGRMTRFGR